MRIDLPSDYAKAGSIPGVRPGMSIKERAALTVGAGYRAFRMGAADSPSNGPFNVRERVHKLLEDCQQAREGVGKNGDWCVDFHQRFDLSDAIGSQVVVVPVGHYLRMPRFIRMTVEGVSMDAR